MEYRRLGKSGLKVSKFSIVLADGRKAGRQKRRSPLMAHAYDNGVNLFDNAERYESDKCELVMGRRSTYGAGGLNIV